MRSHTNHSLSPRTAHSFIAACTLAGSLVLGTGFVAGLGGCSSKGKMNDPLFPEVNIAEAMELKIKGDKLLKDGKHLDAIEQYKAAIRKHPQFGEAWNNLGLALEQDNNRYDAQQAYARAAELSPLDPTPCDNIGVLYMNANLPEDAIKHFRDLLAARLASSLRSLLASVTCPKKRTPFIFSTVCETVRRLSPGTGCRSARCRPSGRASSPRPRGSRSS
jgi:hypothetical protein